DAEVGEGWAVVRAVIERVLQAERVADLVHHHPEFGAARLRLGEAGTPSRTAFVENVAFGMPVAAAVVRRRAKHVVYVVVEDSGEVRVGEIRNTDRAPQTIEHLTAGQTEREVGRAPVEGDAQLRGILGESDVGDVGPGLQRRADRILRVRI